MKKNPTTLQPEIQTMDQYFDSIICSPFFKLNSKSNGIKISLDNPSKPAFPAKTYYAYIIP